MATTVNKYLDNSDFLLATAVYDDAALTISAADGFYQQNGIYRQQVGGVLLAGSTTCPSCSGNSQLLRVNANSATELCCVSSSSFTAHFNTADSFTDPSTTLMYSDAGLLNLAPDGWYQLQGSNQYRQQISGVLDVLTSCPSCPQSNLYLAPRLGVCSDFCELSPGYLCDSSKTTVSGNDFFSLIIGDIILGLAMNDGFYAYASAFNTPVPTGVFKIMELQNNEVISILECDNIPGGPCVNA